jgi:SAM-dependent methyltransferase
MNAVTVPLYAYDDNEQLIPNPLFHRSWDKLHSRCIEYPFAASQVGQAQTLLDVGTAKSDTLWMQWLDSLPISVTVTDYDPSDYPYQRARFQQADVRRLPFEDNTFDVILAVSVIEHIGLSDAQVLSADKPSEDSDGDVEAVRELVRVLKPEGRLVMTFPYGVRGGRILGGSARGYTAESVRRFERVARPLDWHYYEYQYAYKAERFVEPANSLRGGVSRWLKSLTARSKPKPQPAPAPTTPSGIIGAVTWRKIPLTETSATQIDHVDGVLCGTWGKR